MDSRLSGVFRLLWRGLFLDVDAYDDAADSDNPFVDGLFLVVLVGVVVAIANVLGTVLDWAIAPDLSQMRQLILEGMMQMPWFEEMSRNPTAMEMFQQQYDMGWSFAQFAQPSALGAFVTLFAVPLGLILGWLWFGLISQGVARLLGGEGTLGQNLGATALALAPSLLNVFALVPGLVVAVVSTWTLLARYVAVRRVHENLSWPRVLVAVFAPAVISVVLIVLLSIVFSVLFASLIGGLVS